jgi:hypothetical protein
VVPVRRGDVREPKRSFDNGFFVFDQIADSSSQKAIQLMGWSEVSARTIITSLNQTIELQTD